MWAEVHPAEYDEKAEASAREQVRREIGLLMRGFYSWLVANCDSHRTIRSIPIWLRNAPLELDRLHLHLEYPPDKFAMRELELLAGRLMSTAPEIESAPSPEPFQKAATRYLELWRT